MNLYRYFAVIGLLVWATLGLGCATPAKPSAMIPASYELKGRHSFSVSVSGEGGKKTNPLWTSEISTEDFVIAVEESLRGSGVFSSVIRGDQGDYHLHVALVSVDQPLIGFSLTVRISSRWSLTDKSGKSVFDDFVRSEHTATVKDAFAAVERLRLANEGAARKNIQLGIEKLSALTLLNSPRE